MANFRCADLGMDCSFEIEGKDFEELLGPIAAHANIHHGIDEFPDEMIEKLRNVVK